MQVHFTMPGSIGFQMNLNEIPRIGDYIVLSELQTRVFDSIEEYEQYEKSKNSYPLGLIVTKVIWNLSMHGFELISIRIDRPSNVV